MKKNNLYQKLTKKHTKTFYYSTIFFPKEIRQQVFLLYSFVRIIDNFVDRKKPQKKNFYFYKNELISAMNKKNTKTLKIIQDLKKLIQEKKIKKEIFDYLKYQEEELKIKKYQTFKEFIDFTYGVAGTIGIMMAKILNLPKKTHFHAKILGQSLQIINTVRDINEDYKRGKIYLPEDLLSKYQLSQNNFLQKNNRPQLYQVINFLLKEAFKLISKASLSYKYFEKNTLLPVKIAVDLYLKVAQKILKNPEIIFQKKKIKPNSVDITAIILKNYFLIYGLGRKN